MYEFILASRSPRRQTLFSLVQNPFLVIPAHLDETRKKGEKAGDYVQRLAAAKAKTVAEEAADMPPSRDVVIIAADTAVIDEGEILGKPTDEKEARDILLQLRGRKHRVATGIAVHRPGEGGTATELVVTNVTMRDYEESEIDQYIASGDPFDKAGAYAIQHDGFQPVASYEGCFANVMGLPLCHLDLILKEQGIHLEGRVPVQCQEKYNYDCQIPIKLSSDGHR